MEYRMTKIELTRSRGLLNAKKTELQQGLRRRDGIEIVRTADALEEVQFAAARELTTRSLERESELLRDVLAALVRLEDGTYGICVRCEEEISQKRLNAVPWTPLCIECQERADDRHRVAPELRYIADAA